jgi:hypothetical protein
VSGRFARKALLALSLVALPAGARSVAAQDSVQATSADSAVVRALELAAANDTARGRVVLDSLIRAKIVPMSARAEATYWRSRFSTSAAERERLLGALIVDHPFSPRLSAALHEIATLELARNDRERAATHLARFLAVSPGDSNRVSASLTLGRILLESGDQARGCAVLLAGRGEIPSTAIETRNQFEFAAGRCQGVDTTARPPQPSASDSAATRRRSGAFTVQVAAYDTRNAADRLATTLRGQGLEARVIGTTKPFRVRVGRYATRAEAEAASNRIDAMAKTKSFVVVVGPEEP